MGQAGTRTTKASATNATAAAGMIRRSVSGDTSSAEPKQHAALVLVQDVVQASEVEQLLLAQSVAVVRTRVASKRLWQALLGIGVVVLLEGLASKAARELAEELRIEELNVFNHAPDELLRQLREKGILPPEKGSQQ